MKKFSTLTLAAIVATAFAVGSAHAQTGPGTGNAVLQTPPDISTILSIDAHNALIIGTRDPRTPNAPQSFSYPTPRHIYSGGIARIFGGTVVPTETLVIPESALRAGVGSVGAGIQNFGGQGFGGQGFGGQGFGVQNFSGQGFRNQNFGGQNSTAYNRGFAAYPSRVPVQNLSQFNQIYGYLDRPVPQAQVNTNQ